MLQITLALCAPRVVTLYRASSARIKLKICPCSSGFTESGISRVMAGASISSCRRRAGDPGRRLRQAIHGRPGDDRGWALVIKGKGRIATIDFQNNPAYSSSISRSNVQHSTRQPTKRRRFTDYLDALLLAIYSRDFSLYRTFRRPRDLRVEIELLMCLTHRPAWSKRQRRWLLMTLAKSILMPWRKPSPTIPPSPCGNRSKV